MLKPLDLGLPEQGGGWGEHPSLGDERRHSNSWSPWHHFCLWFCSMNNLVSCFYQFSHTVLKGFAGLRRLWIAQANLMGVSLIPVCHYTRQKTPVCLQAWDGTMLDASKAILHLLGETPCMLERNFKSCGNWLQNYLCAEYKGVLKGLVTNKEKFKNWLWRGSSWEIEILEGYLFKYIYCYILNNCICNLLLSLFPVVAILDVRGGVLGLEPFCSRYHRGDGIPAQVVCAARGLKPILAMLQL